jgi:hypothetical protein
MNHLTYLYNKKGYIYKYVYIIYYITTCMHTYSYEHFIHILHMCTKKHIYI